MCPVAKERRRLARHRTSAVALIPLQLPAAVASAAQTEHGWQFAPLPKKPALHTHCVVSMAPPGAHGESCSALAPHVLQARQAPPLPPP